MTSADLARWVVLGLLLAGALLAYFQFAPRVPPAIPVLPVQESR